MTAGRVSRWSLAVAAAAVAGWAAFDDPSERGLRRFCDSLAAEAATAGDTPRHVREGRDGWIFLERDVEIVCDRGLLESSQGEPLRAILGFSEFLRSRNVQLVVLTVPPKPAVHPDHLAAGIAPHLARSPSQREFDRTLRQHGIWVVDAFEVLDRHSRSGEGAAFLRTDSHWSPAGVDAFARATAELVADRVDLSPHRIPFGRSAGVRIEQIGDTAMALFDRDLDSLPRETVEIRPVAGSDPLSGPSEVLVLGDSFSGIYSNPQMGWGQRAGFPDLLAAYLGRPVDRVLVMGGGASKSRRNLSRSLEDGSRSLDGVKVVIFEFAARELASGQWETPTYPAAADGPTRLARSPGTDSATR